MKIEIPFVDRHGNPIELGQRIAIKVPRLSGSYGSWYRHTNINHVYFWVPGHLEIHKNSGVNHAVRIGTVLDKESVEALEQPMGDEKIKQVVAECQVEIDNPESFDAVNIPAPGTFVRTEEPCY